MSEQWTPEEIAAMKSQHVPATPERMAELEALAANCPWEGGNGRPLTGAEAFELYANKSAFRPYLADDHPFKLPLQPK